MVQGKPDAQALKNAYEYGFAVGCSLQKIPNLHKPKLMKCLVCGEIFDASLGICPVCGVGLEQCVPVDEELVAFRNDTDNRYVILGGGVAAVSAAEAIRRRDKTGSIRMISAEPYLPINRPMLTKDLKAVAADPEGLRVHDAQWYQELDVMMSLGCTVTGIDPQTKTVITQNGEVTGYDKLIYAMGAECFVPPFAGHNKSGVITVRHLADVLRLGELTKCAKNAVVIGGGVLGLEAASEIMRTGVKVTILEATPQIVGRQVDAGSAAVLKTIIRSMGAECYEGVTIAEIEGEDKVTAVRLMDGSVFPADFVVVSCGNRANVQVAKDAGINVERAIVVDSRMRTSIEDIYACGDCAQLEGINYQLWQEASNQGKAAGANAAGDCITYANQMMGLSLEGFGTELFAIGDPGKGSNTPYHTVHVRDDVANRQETYWFCCMPTSHYVEESIRYIHRYYAEEISQTSIADAIGISPSYLSKQFKEDLGIGFADFLCNYRLEKAKALLAQTEKSNKEIAGLVGFSDDAYFSRVFKKDTGITPKEYRKKHRAK